MARPKMGERRIHADTLAAIIREKQLSHVEVARRLSGEKAGTTRTESERGQLLKYLRGQTRSITPERAAAVSEALGVHPDDWSDEVTQWDLAEYDLEKLKARTAHLEKQTAAIEQFLASRPRPGRPQDG